MSINGYYAKSNPELRREIEDNGGLPVISQNLDSVRAYQWEIHFHPPSQDIPTPGTFSKPLTLAAKQVSQIGFSVDDIEVHRVNDKVYYPGKASPDELVITFDNLRDERTSFQLYKWMQSIYNPKTGEFTSDFNTSPANFKTNIDIVQLGSDMEPISVTKVYGSYPKTWKLAEFNYSTNEFHTIEASFRFDFLAQNQND